MWICLFLSLSLILCPSFPPNPSEWSWVLLIPNITFCFCSFPLISFIKYVLVSLVLLFYWSLVLLFIHDSASPKPHSHLCNGCHRNVCGCVSIFVWAKCVYVCDWVNFIPPPPPCLPSFGKGAYALGARGGNSVAGGGNWGEAVCPTCLYGPHWGSRSETGPAVTLNMNKWVTSEPLSSRNSLDPVSSCLMKYLINV